MPCWDKGPAPRSTLPTLVSTGYRAASPSFSVSSNKYPWSSFSSMIGSILQVNDIHMRFVPWLTGYIKCLSWGIAFPTRGATKICLFADSYGTKRDRLIYCLGPRGFSRIFASSMTGPISCDWTTTTIHSVWLVQAPVAKRSCMRSSCAVRSTRKMACHEPS
ncbi:hypothetical protein BDV33DRAFT_136531 [Aspergillus novoparasiticus]|uniref:Uncharacterized protein n=1 Tax=Aspergillus novoparasiticus TaxID=986946 RepID=A0A5N6F544_9EURO|nr:hypothetical protein BDV33DRAFT_136531 [Aspergillus novoparasiticus]